MAGPKFLAHLAPPALRLARLSGVIVLGLLFVILPTLLGLFPSLSNLSLGDRLAILLGWIAVASVAGLATARADEHLHAKVDEQRQAAVVSEHRVLLTQRLGALLGTALPTNYRLTLYAPAGDYLFPVFPRAVGTGDPAIFPMGVGATGKAWESDDELFIIKGEAVSSDKHGLTPAQQAMYRRYKVVAAVVVTDDAGEHVGVLTAIGLDDDGYFDHEGLETLSSLADEVSWMMSEVVLWMLPTDEEIGL